MEVIIVILFVIAFIAFKTQITPGLKGDLGERIVSFKLKDLPFEQYKIINDITLKNDKHSSQIDHVVICDYGIIVIETKYYKGWIFGGEKNSYWTQVIYKKKFKIINPIIQNKGHIKALKNNLVKYSNVPFHQIVVLAGSCEFKSFDEVETDVIYPAELMDTLSNIKSKIRLSKFEIDEINNILLNAESNNKITRKEHIRNTRIKLEEKKLSIDSGKCPSCSGKLVIRSGKFGRFYGCGNYPRCKFTKKL